MSSPDTGRKARSGSPLGGIVLAAAMVLLPKTFRLVHDSAAASAAGQWAPGLVYGGFVLSLAAAALLVAVVSRVHEAKR